LSFFRTPRQAYRPKPHDLWSAALFFAFALFSFLWPDTGSIALGDHSLPRGYLVAAILATSGVLALLLGGRDFSASPRPLRFVRCFYPQIFFGPLFTESIILSGRAMGGRVYDPFFYRLDGLIFGHQPSMDFSAAFGHAPWMNEIMFGSYFSFYLVMALTPWIPWFRGDEAEGEREVSILAGFMLVVYVFYVFFRVVGPKHYFPNLDNYGVMQGGFFTHLEGGILSAAITTGAAFPSSHVAVSLMMTSFVARTARRLLPLYILDACLIALATIYLHAHWAVDVAGGMVAALLLVPLFARLHRPIRDRGLAL